MMPEQYSGLYRSKRGYWLPTLFIRLFIVALITFVVQGVCSEGEAQNREGGNVVRKPVKRPAPETKPASRSKKEEKKAPAEGAAAKAEEEKEQKGQEKEQIDLEKEIARLDELIKKDGKNADLFYNRGCLFVSQGKKVRALEDFNKAIEIDEDHSDAYFNRGLLYAKMGRHEMAVENFGEVIKRNPKAYDAFCNRGAAYLAKEEYRLAVKDFNAAIEIAPEDPDLYRNRGLAYKALGEDKKADADMKKATKLGKMEGETKTSLRPKVLTAKGTEGASLKKAALDCDLSSFMECFDKKTRVRVKRFEALRLKVQRAFEAFFNKSKELFGDKVQRKGRVLRFRIKGEDPRWTELLGPQWEKLKESRPDEPRFFIVQSVFGWTSECRVLSAFQACLEDPKLCKETKIEGSAIQMQEVNGSWKLVSNKKQAEWDQAFRAGESLTEVLKWAEEYISQKSSQMPYEELILTMAEGYFQRISSAAQS